ncbi:MAG TPA: hypothetical protein VLC28_07360, partial [Flavitalea sp.]|nr:hypothetical protein [Flavitalea sp.]
ARGIVRWHSNSSSSHNIIVMENKTLRLHTSWEHVKEKIKERNIEVSDEDLEYVPGEESELLQRLTGKLGNSPDEVRRFIESISANEDMAG